MKCCSYKSMLTVGSILMVLGIIITATSDIVLDFVLKQNMVLSSHSASYPMWKNLPLPLTNKIYLFNITNAEEVAQRGAKPKITEVGPYVFKEYHTKIDEVWNENGTVTYKQINKWIPVSNNLDDLVTIVNAPAATLAAMIEPLTHIQKVFVDLGLKIVLSKEKLFVTKTAREILFDGYKDPILEAGTELEKVGIKMPGLMSKFGFFFSRNNTWYGNGIVNIHTGEFGLSQMGNVAAFNYSDHNTFYPGECGKYSGSPDLSPPYLLGKEKQYVFNPDLGRTLELTLSDRQANVKGTTGYEYKMDKLFFANSTNNPKNKCFEHGHPLPNGVFNASAARFGAPVFMSQPHFYQADPYYANLIAKGSLKPDSNLHETSFVFEPISGVAMRVSARFQVNFKLDRIKELSMFKNLPKVTYLPTVWFEEHIELPQSLVSEMWFLGNLRTIIIITGGLMIAFGMSSIVYGLFECRARKYVSMASEVEGTTAEESTEVKSDEEDLTEDRDENHDSK